MRHTNPSIHSRDSKSSDSEPTKRYNSFQFQSQLRNSQLGFINTSRFSGDIACAFHSDQKITNFCKNKQCLLPLCPKCVGVHCQQHSKRGVFGDFITIDDSLTEVSRNLKAILSKLENTQKWMGKQKYDLEDKESKLNTNLTEAKHNFLQKIKMMMQNYQEAVRSIWSIQAKVEAEHFNQVQQYKDIMLSNCNRCLKKLLNPSQRLQGLIQYYYYEQQFNKVDSIQKDIEIAVSQPIFNIELRLQKHLLEKVFKECFRPSSQQQQIWSEFKVTNQMRTQKVIQRKIAKPNQSLGNMINLDNFVSPLTQFSLHSLRQKSKYS